MVKRISLSIVILFCLAGSFLFAALWTGNAQAQSCRPACDPSGPYPTYRDGGCYNTCSPPAPCSHTRAECASGETLNVESGMCIPAGGCGGCEERPVCPEGLVYTGNDGSNGICQSSSGLGYKSHQLVPCPTGWTLAPERGVCRGNCRSSMLIAPGGIRLTLRPDLVFQNAFVRPSGSEKPTNTIRRGERYFACYTVANVGSIPSGPFRVGGGGLGIPVAPFQDHAGLAAGASRAACIAYPTTPPPGDYRLGLKVDSLDAVSESREDNNTREISVRIVP